MSDVVINVTVSQGGTVDADLAGATTIETTVEPGGQIASTVTGGGVGATGPTGPTGPTGGIVPITVSVTAPSSPLVNDLWIDIS